MSELTLESGPGRLENVSEDNETLPSLLPAGTLYGICVSGYT